MLIVDYNSIRNFITKLDILCYLDEYSVNFTRAVFLSRIFSTLFFSYITDIHGRKITYFFIIGCLIISNFSFLFCSNPTLYIIIGFISNMSKSFYNLVILFGVETMGVGYYSILTGILGFLYAICSIVSILILGFFYDWHIILYFHIILNFLGLYLGIKYIVETPMFLLSTFRYHELNQVLIKISRINNTQENVELVLNEIEVLNKMKNNDHYDLNCRNSNNKSFSESIKYIISPYIKIMSTNNEMTNLMLLSIPYIAMHAIYFIQVFNLYKLPGNLLTNSSAIYAGEFFSTLVGRFLVNYYGKKKILYLFHFICLLTIISIPIIQNNQFILFICLFAFSYSICTVFIPTNLLCAELFETTVRSTATGILLIVSNFVIIIGDYLIIAFYSQTLLFIILNIATLYVITKLPEN